MDVNFEDNPVSIEELARECQSLKEGRIADKLASLQKIRSALTMQKNLPISIIIDTNIIPVLVEGVKCNKPKVEFECIWILCNVASGNENQTREVMYSGIAPIFISILQSTNDRDLIQIIMWCMGNLCGDEKCRNILVTNNILSITTAILKKYYLNQEIMENCIFCLRNALSDSKMQNNNHIKEIRMVLSIVSTIVSLPKGIEMHTGLMNDILQLCLSILESLSGDSKDSKDSEARVMLIVEKCVAVMNSSVIASIRNEEEATTNYPTKAIMECLGNIFSESDAYAQYLVERGVLEFLRDVYFDKNNDDQLCRLEVLFCWMNLSGGNQCQSLYNTGILPFLVDTVTSLSGDSDAVLFEASRRSVFIICNFVCDTNEESRHYMIQNGIQGVLERYRSMIQGHWVDEDASYVDEVLMKLNMQ